MVVVGGGEFGSAVAGDLGVSAGADAGGGGATESDSKPSVNCVSIPDSSRVSLDSERSSTTGSLLKTPLNVHHQVWSLRLFF